ncbi:MAG TPA: hypothetical protein VMS88_03740 [Terriglobales bacterium]|nr:hypothetical protein [Terriglobales bacterium]
MRRNQRFGIATGVGIFVLAVLVMASSAAAGVVVVPPRPGQVGVSVSGLYGTFLKQGDFGSEFSSGPGLAVRLRYRMRYERAFGLTFEVHNADVRPGDFPDLIVPTTTYPAGDPFAAQRANLYLYGIDFYQLFGTRTKTTRMLNVGAGIAHPVIDLEDGEKEFPWSDGVFVNAGAGFERFFWQGLAWELGARYQAVFINGSTNHDLRVSAGLVFYASL